MRVDLHCHSTASDGVLAPAALVQRAHEKGVGLLALTDHDTLEGLPEAHQAARSTRYRTGQRYRAVLHLGRCHHSCAGLRFRPRRRSPAPGDRSPAPGPLARAEEIDRRLAAKGMPGALEGARAIQRALGDSGNAPARPHFAEFLVQGGWVRIAPTRSASGWGPASWETSSSTGRPWRKWSAACARRAPGSAWRTRIIMISPGPSAGAWSPTLSRPADTPSRWSMACSRPNRSVPCRSWPASSA